MLATFDAKAARKNYLNSNNAFQNLLANLFQYSQTGRSYQYYEQSYSGSLDIFAEELRDRGFKVEYRDGDSNLYISW